MFRNSLLSLHFFSRLMRRTSHRMTQSLSWNMQAILFQGITWRSHDLCALQHFPSSLASSVCSSDLWNTLPRSGVSQSVIRSFIPDIALDWKYVDLLYFVRYLAFTISFKLSWSFLLQRSIRKCVSSHPILVSSDSQEWTTRPSSFLCGVLSCQLWHNAHLWYFPPLSVNML